MRISVESVIRKLRGFVDSRVARTVGLCGAAAILLLTALSLWVDADAHVDEARPVDTLIVLGSAVWPGERASPSLYERAEHAIALYKQGYASSMILSGGLGQFPPSEAEVMRRLAAGSGIPDSALLLDDTSHSTEENLSHAKQIMEAHGWRSALIVSDPFHLLRARVIARDYGIEAYGSPATASPTFTILHLRVWYTVREAAALIWYVATRSLGTPAWLYHGLKSLGL
ncbi:MAG: YdcF family protein [Chloroflexi bacterium]|nr:YdcF family protein [Chloroflexota bacterium]